MYGKGTQSEQELANHRSPEKGLSYRESEQYQHMRSGRAGAYPNNLYPSRPLGVLVLTVNY